MKHRLGFVSNSSSASFIICKAYITEEQIQQVQNYFINDNKDGWNMKEDKQYFEGWTIMDNGNLSDFCEKIGIERHLKIGE